MNKTLLLDKILTSLEAKRELAINAAMEAYNTATADENIAENKYDTLGLEASYLAQGQAQRVAEIEDDIAAYKSLMNNISLNSGLITLGSLVHIVDEKGAAQTLFLGPKAGGLSIYDNELEIKIITPHSPIGAALLKRQQDDEFELNIAGNSHNYEILEVN